MEGGPLLYNQLADEAIRAEKKLWCLAPKHRMATHLAYDFACMTNPRHVHCDADEDMVGRTKRLTQQCHDAYAGCANAWRCRMLVGVRWWKRLGELRGAWLECHV